MNDQYTSISDPTEGLFKDKGSKFVAYAYPVKTIEQITHHLENIKKLHPKSRHLCYAWSLGNSGTLYRVNDDGEPSGTAGKPILGQIRSFGYSDILVGVVRYFGGTLLGASGLIQAYRESAKDALSRSIAEVIYISDVFQIKASYAFDKKITQLLPRFDAKVLKANYEADITWNVSVRQGISETFLIAIKAAVGDMSADQAAKTESIPGLSIQKLEIC
jgi:uncharacterized YigZ family protein